MRKLFTLMACAALTAGSAFADIKIGETTYSTLKDAVAAGADGDADAPVKYFNLQGQPVANPAAGIYIRRQGTKIGKVIMD